MHTFIFQMVRIIIIELKLTDLMNYSMVIAQTRFDNMHVDFNIEFEGFLVINWA